ncbi:DNA mismatch repair protein MutS [Sedimentibacter sp. zth1]|uniref:MutS-related protein n=1 Tax=Sedimentibacter sp. zth1 TaxID=2816908 RepID=UPI001A917351|nr:DNA mismatch repair protein MutS [Sedimentibacter sp. zth1]QSX06654.1 DNA mismatch repair protein MutS [Sedimentibacter sp. zth1]
MIKKYLCRKDNNHINKKDIKDVNFCKLEQANNYFNKTSSSVDDITWNDLDMNNVFARINYTVTTPGEECLYSWLKNPLEDKKELEERMDFISRFNNNKTILHKLRMNLSKIGYFKYNFRKIMESNFLVNYVMLALFIILATINFAIIAYSISIKDFFLLPILMLIFTINLFVHYKFIMKYGEQLEVLNYILRLLSFSRNNKKLLEQFTSELANRLDKINDILIYIAKKGKVIFTIEGLDVLADYINITFLLKEINFLMISKQMHKHKKEIIEVYELIGELDAILSINKYRSDLDYYCEPNIDYNIEEIHITDMYHPLINNAISNSISMSKAIVITGSNMSGKSTFLRTIGLNALFAQSICTSLSKEHRTSFYRLITSISLNDDVLKNKSYFLMEAEAIKRMISLKDDKYPSLILIDEIFKGTNPAERLAASMEILNILALSNTKVFVTTHDLQILSKLVGYEYYYFTENVTKESMKFDYKIRRGVTTTRNAIKILEFIKYPDDLITKINKRIDALEI